MARIKKEIIRFFYLKKNYGFDTILEIIEDFIFLYGILAVSTFVGKGVTVFFFAMWYVGWIILNEGVDELENEIRTDQLKGLQTTDTSIFTIYLGRACSYGLYGILRLILFLVLFNPRLLPELSKKLVIGESFIMIFFHFILTLLLFEILISLTLRYQRISTMVNLLYTASIFASGLVTPFAKKWSYRYWLEKASDSFAGILLLSLLILVFIFIFLVTKKRALKQLNGSLDVK